MTNLELAKKYEGYMVDLRRHFHENPELSGQEFKTVERISEELTNMGIEHIVVEDGGVLGFIRGEKPGKMVLLRADCDALPVLEKENLNNTRSCWSKVPGVMHACGHDAHTAALLGAAKILLEKKDEIEGTVLLCFERGEEGAGNSINLFVYMDKHGIKPDTTFGMHIDTTVPTGQIAINDKDMLAGAMGFDITIEGRGGHGSRPDQSINPINCFTAINQRLQELRLLKVTPFETCTYSIGKLEAGVRGNVIPQKVNFAGTMRCFDTDGVGAIFAEEFKNAVDGICAAYGCVPTYNRYSKPGFATVNDPEYAQYARKVIATEFGAENVVLHEPLMGSESYSQYLKQWPGVFGLIGVGNPEKGVGAANHNEKFDLDEDALVWAATAHVTYALNFLKDKPELNHGPKLSVKECLIRLDREDEIEALYNK